MGAAEVLIGEEGSPKKGPHHGEKNRRKAPTW